LATAAEEAGLASSVCLDNRCHQPGGRPTIRWQGGRVVSNEERQMIKKLVRQFANSSSLRVVAVVLGMTVLSISPVRTQPGQLISGNTPGFVQRATKIGPVDPTTVITATVWLKLHNEQQLDRLVQQQYQPGSAAYRRWITQDQFNAQFGPTAQEVNSVVNFVVARGLTVLTVAENNMYVKVQGSVGAVQAAFHVQLNDYSVNGRSFRSNAADPMIADAAGAHVAAITGLDDVGFEPAHVRPTDANGAPFPMTPLGAQPQGAFFEGQCFGGVETRTFTAGPNTATYTGNRYGADITNTAAGHLPPCGYAPDEMQTAYNLKALYAQGLDGTGETIVITDAFGSPTIREDAEAFSQVYGLPDLTPSNFQVLRAPGASNNPHGAGWDVETTLDVEWAHAMAPGANIVLVVGPTNHSDLDEAINWAVIHHLGNTISNSWLSLEGFGNPAQFDRVNRILEMAAAQGIDVNFASGDDGDFVARFGFRTVGFPASSPFATGIGGTSLALDTGNAIAFQTGWGNNLTRIADVKSAGTPPVIPPLSLGFNGGAGGGDSLTFAKPDFQGGLPGNVRKVPDIALLADPFTGAEFIETVNGQLSVGVVGGTSLATPMFSGVMAIAAQKAGHGLGQAAALVYNLPAGAVSDVVAFGSPNNVTGLVNGQPFSANALAAPLGNTTTYFSALYNSPFSTRWFVLTFGTDSSLTTGVGWDNVTGVGTPNGVDFVNAVGK
jgi:subtilase family serine protease